MAGMDLIFYKPGLIYFTHLLNIKLKLHSI
jgi:hypothetical protein